MDDRFLIDVTRCSEPANRSAPIPELLETANRVAQNHGLSAKTLEPVAGGLSGADVFRCTCAEGPVFAIRRWPIGTDPTRIACLHRIANRLRQAGFRQFAQPIPAPVSGETVHTDQHGRLWHIETWQPGSPRTSLPRSDAATLGRLLAQLHVALQRIEEPHDCFTKRDDIPPTVTERIQLCRNFRQRHHQLAQLNLPNNARTTLAAAFKRLPHIESALSDEATAGKDPLQICLRDLKTDSVLWTDNTITGLIDINAARVDHPTADIARLFGSFFGEHDRESWQAAIDAYTAVRPLSDADHRRIQRFVSSEVVLSTLGWIDKLFAIRRPTPPTTLELTRFQHFTERLFSSKQ